MAKRKPQSRDSRKRPSRQPGAKRAESTGAGGPPRRRRSDVRLRQVPGGQQWEFVHPRCARDRAEDIEEVHAMIDGGEDEIAIDELRWLLNGCPDFIEAHKLLGELALSAGDIKLARAHFGYAYDIGLSALPQRGLPGPLAYERAANQPFFESAKALAWCFRELQMPAQGREVLDTLLQLDPSDPLGLAAMRSQIDGSGDPRPPSPQQPA